MTQYVRWPVTYDAPIGIARESISILARFVTHVIHEEDECPIHDKYDHDDYYSYSRHSVALKCNCNNPDRKMITTQIIVTVPENPVRSKPSECVYTIRVHTYCTNQASEMFDILDLTEYDIEFSIAATISDITTVPDDKQELVKKYFGNIAYQAIHKWTIFSSFSGTTDASKYTLYFQELITFIIASSQQIIVANSCTRGGVHLVSVNSANGARGLKGNPHMGKKKKREK